MSELAQAIEEMRNMRESYDQLAGAAEAYNDGKSALAEAITAKGVETAATDSLATMAEKVMTISQDTYEINGGEMYAKQLFGSLETPNYWNLYDIMEQLLSDGRLVNYGGILLAEYYKGYDSIALAGAGTGGAYVVSDKDENGQFKMYTADTTHTWDTEFNGKGNRWVAYCFADDAHIFQITNTSTSPRSIHIGRHVGAIECLVNSRVAQIIVTDGNKLDDFVCGQFQHLWLRNVRLRNIGHSAGYLLWQPNCDSIYISGDELLGGNALIGLNNVDFAPSSIIIETGKLRSAIFEGSNYLGRATNLSYLAINSPDISARMIRAGYGWNNTALRDLVIKTEYCNFDCSKISAPTNCNIYISYINNDRTKSVNISGTNFFSSVQKLEIQDGWCKPLNLASATALTEQNIIDYILQRLKQDEPDCGVGVTITLGATNLAKLTSKESIDLLDALTNTYGYTFA